MSKQLDNSNLAEKLALRTRLIREANIEPLRVLETCCGAGVLWSQLLQRFKVMSYTPCDRAPRIQGAIKLELDDRHLNAFDISRFNVIDIDPYGDPFIAWVNLSKRITQRTVFFLTHGNTRSPGNGAIGKPQASKILRSGNGIPIEWDIPHDYDFSWYLGFRLIQKSTDYLNILRCLMIDHRTVRYYGLIAEPKAAGIPAKG